MAIPAIPSVLITAAKAVIAARVHEQLVREAIDPIHAEALRTWKPTVSAKMASRGAEASTPIATWNHLYLADAAINERIDADVVRMIAERHPALVQDDPSKCPLLVAENDLRNAKRALVQAAAEWEPLRAHKLDWNTLVCAGLDKLEKFVDLTMRMVVTATPSLAQARTA